MTIVLIFITILKLSVGKCVHSIRNSAKKLSSPNNDITIFLPLLCEVVNQVIAKGMMEEVSMMALYLPKQSIMNMVEDSVIPREALHEIKKSPWAEVCHHLQPSSMMAWMTLGVHPPVPPLDTVERW